MMVHWCLVALVWLNVASYGCLGLSTRARVCAFKGALVQQASCRARYFHVPRQLSSSFGDCLLAVLPAVSDMADDLQKKNASALIEKVS
jgi:hypothetical protein